MLLLARAFAQGGRMALSVLARATCGCVVP